MSEIQIERHPGPWIGEDAEFARACAMVAIADYGSDDAVTHQRILKDGVWNDHVAVQAALATIHNLRKSGLKSHGDVGQLTSQVQALVKGLSAALGYLKNADIDLATGATKKTARSTIEGGIKMVEHVLAVHGDSTRQLIDTQRPEGK